MLVQCRTEFLISHSRILLLLLLIVHLEPTQTSNAFINVRFILISLQTAIAIARRASTQSQKLLPLAHPRQEKPRQPPCSPCLRVSVVRFNYSPPAPTRPQSLSSPQC